MAVTIAGRAERAVWHSMSVHSAVTLERAKVICEGLCAEELSLQKELRLPCHFWLELRPTRSPCA